ncbi:Uncharacterised protein [Mycobacteroides abscessus subsp. abscessus]|nr:Uncharacterised protein [Mycobacteroides abscessus subsp. abscessus]
MGHDQGALPISPQYLAQQCPDGGRALGIKPGQRFVEQHQLGFGRQGTCDGHPLRLSPGQLTGAALGEIAGTDRLQPPVPYPGDVASTDTELDVARHRQMGKQQCLLEQ